MKSHTTLAAFTEGMAVNETIDNGPALTVERLRQFKGFENTTDEQALNYIHTICHLCQLTAKAVFTHPLTQAA